MKAEACASARHGCEHVYGYRVHAAMKAEACASARSEQPGMGVNQPAAVDYSPDLTGSVREALRNSDRFAWVYNEGVGGRSWWDNSMPAAIVAAVGAGRAQA